MRQRQQPRRAPWPAAISRRCRRYENTRRVVRPAALQRNRGACSQAMLAPPARCIYASGDLDGQHCNARAGARLLPAGGFALAEIVSASSSPAPVGAACCQIPLQRGLVHCAPPLESFPSPPPPVRLAVSGVNASGRVGSPSESPPPRSLDHGRPARATSRPFQPPPKSSASAPAKRHQVWQRCQRTIARSLLGRSRCHVRPHRGRSRRRPAIGLLAPLPACESCSSCPASAAAHDRGMGVAGLGAMPIGASISWPAARHSFRPSLRHESAVVSSPELAWCCGSTSLGRRRRQQFSRPGVHPRSSLRRLHFQRLRKFARVGILFSSRLGAVFACPSRPIEYPTGLRAARAVGRGWPRLQRIHPLDFRYRPRASLATA